MRAVISTAASRVTVRVIRTDEEQMIAKISLLRPRSWHVQRKKELRPCDENISVIVFAGRCPT